MCAKGHAGIVHGGLLATILDEALARTALLNLPSKIGVTARLELDYRSPVRADQFLALHIRLVELDGRKAWVEGWVEPLSDTPGTHAVEAK